MFRKNQLLGCMMAAFGVGMLAACFFESGFFCGCLGLGLVVAGVVFCRKK